MIAESSLEEEQVLVFKNVNQERICEHCIKNFDSLLELAMIDTDRQYFCESCPLGRLANCIARGPRDD